MNIIFFPFETKLIHTFASIDEIKILLCPILNNGLLNDFNKKLRAKKINNQKLLLKTSKGFIIQTQLYYLEKINSNTIKVFSRNNMVMSAFYIFMFLFGLIGTIYSVIVKESIQNITIFCFFSLGCFVTGNGIQKIVRYSQIEEIESYLLKK